ncbi:thioredoxin family protein [Aquabacterium sp.]|uniref:thioredoxin family protein n=1 Tax=Aquabacterium sp. TaxID=1872578 RepID=UPI002BFB579B|nr:thioredoxin family protein [Aquabacterium sp.]HSW04204.1 thioredoxin family protein [Aquabacterium sp.]
MSETLPAEATLVACLCAAWCGTCTSYRGTLAAAAAAHPELHFAWIDIEDDSDALGEAALDIEDFPTLMLLRAGRPLFHGTVLPHAGTLARLLAALAEHSLAPGDAARVPPAMAAAVWRLAPLRPV